MVWSFRPISQQLLAGIQRNFMGSIIINRRCVFCSPKYSGEHTVAAFPVRSLVHPCVHSSHISCFSRNISQKLFKALTWNFTKMDRSHSWKVQCTRTITLHYTISELLPFSYFVYLHFDGRHKSKNIQATNFHLSSVIKNNSGSIFRFSGFLFLICCEIN